mmetsp:Transcript_31587/g.66424  ORF Transcript_31587/g.66424 Transcript_31587/m.66424 type:complete len:88 (+) Transcript_31587:909-1172(+)
MSQGYTSIHILLVPSIKILCNGDEDHFSFADDIDSTPDDSIVTSTSGFPSFVPTASMSSTNSNPSKTMPNTTFLLSSHDVLTVLMKN